MYTHRGSTAMIHYHGVPFSGGVQAELALVRRHAFVSFHRPESIELCAEVCQSIAIDNGAYSAWKAGTSYDIEAYADFVAEWFRHPAVDFYVLPDVIDGSTEDNVQLRGRWRNLCVPNMYALGVPVWHMHEPLNVLFELADAYDRVALGSSGDFTSIGTPRWWARMAEAMATVCDSEGRPLTKLHGLRMLDPTVFSWIPLASADSTHVARSIGFDTKWGRYAPKSKATRAAVLMERVEHHASAARWNGEGWSKSNNELFA